MIETRRNIIVIGTSAGGFGTLPKLISQFPEDFPASFLIVQHLAEGASPLSLVKNLQKSTKLICKIANHGESIKYSHIYLAPPDHHMLIKNEKIIVIRGPRENRFRPSIDMLFRSAAVAYNSSVIGIIITGMLNDGTSGLEAIKKCGGISIVQNPEDAEWPEMPLSALKNTKVDHIVPVSEMGSLLEKLIYEPINTSTSVPNNVLIEAEIAERYLSGIDDLSQIGKQISVSCPDCGGALWEVTGNDLPRFRCHVGHVFNETGLIKSQAQAMEETLWVSLRMMEERLYMLMKILERENKFGNKGSTIERIEEVKIHISRIRQIINSNAIYNDWKD
jgi:two-component system, chemotaxis family, protein-glutamate methylesterase/glutaminase